MPDIIQVLALAMMPAFGNFAGGMAAEFLPVSRRALNFALHAAAGVVLAVVAVELLGEALEAVPTGVLALAFGLGGAANIALESVVERLSKSRRGQDDEGSTGPWMVYIAVATDLFSDGLMIGAGSSISFSLALALAVGQVLADIPEGFATIANFKGAGTSRRRRIALAASFAIPILIAAVLAYWMLRGADPVWKFAALTFVAGLLVVAAVEDMINEAHDASGDARGSVAFLVGGFCLFVLISGYFGAE